MINLYSHNSSAYSAAVSMLSETGKAAIIRPTGTGKSFIGFKYCEEHPNDVVCWLSPSEYIFRTQVENLKKNSDGYFPGNIKFYTYAKLMIMKDEEIAQIAPSIVILDEYHRVGAPQWKTGVERLFAANPGVPILGLSATNIRYLDNRRNMAEELFDGNIASEMTLGEAIVRGILAAPKYVLSVYSYQKELERYKRRVRSAKNRAVRKSAEKYLEALRRALDKADGMNKIFKKHMTDKTGKYIVFCANAEHMAEMIDKSREWFADIDSEPHIYTVYSEDSSSGKSFREFKDDNDSAHLRLLYCIDQLNEGIHVDGISGVILLRPTVSPIVYKQQIGRALAAGCGGTPVIFDIVMNIENLYSIGAVEEEMQIAMTYYRSRGLDGEIVNERFAVSDEIRDCVELFEKLNDTLSASWDTMFAMAEDYYRENGNLEIPYRYKTADGYSLGRWILTQKKVRAGKQFGKLTDEQIDKLNSIGMVWDGYRDESWKKFFAAAAEYSKRFGNLNVAAAYVTDDGVLLGRWISNLRAARKNGSKRNYLTPARIDELNRLGMVWDVADSLWQQYYGACITYRGEHGDLNVPLAYVTGDGLRLGVWMQNIRSAYNGTNKAYRLTDEQIRALDALGMMWNTKSDRAWAKGIAEATAYSSMHGDLNVPSTYKTPGGYALGKWIAHQRKSKRLSPERREQLSGLGMVWQKPDSWEIRYNLAKQYYSEHGNLNVPASYTPNGVWLNKWLNEQQHIYAGNRGGKQLTEEQISRLEEIGMVWKKGKKPA